MSKRIVLKDAFKGYTLDQDKIVTPEETVERFKERLRKVDTDILEKTVRIDNGRLDIPVYFSVCGRDAEQMIGTKKQMGKGGTPAQAEASAVMELAERFSFFSFSKTPGNFFVEKQANLKEEAIPFEAIAKSVHDSSDELERSLRIFSELPLKWTRGYNLTKEKEVLIPFDWFFAINEFNGPSAGNCVEEAISQGICELVERHVSSIVSRGKMKTPAINPDSVTDPLVLAMLGKYRKAGVKLFISDFSLNTGIPSVGVLGYDPSTLPGKSEIVWTAGTTPDPQKALSRALTEVAQLAGDFNSGANYVASGLPKFRELSEADFVMQPASTVDIMSLPHLSHDNIRVEVENCVSALKRNHLDVLLIDVMHPKLQIPAFYTIIPGAYFRERAVGTSVGMFSAKLISTNENPLWALAQLEKMDRLLPDKYYIKFYKGLVYLAVREHGKALDELGEALRLEPKEEDIPSIYSYMGVCFKELEQYRKAIEVLRKAEQHDDERTDVYNLLGFCFYKLGEHEKAIECFQEVLKLNPSSAIDYANIASNYRDMGNREMAIRYYTFALELDQDIEFARENLRKLEGD
ncbi:MAG TPA: tetratricopeptide repeat protein [Deltaproteobacteria bacterium]|nr:tetratricopeptide repeat protein [Deltaproteobacteria bacterium]HIJ39538.1 tetratricopeptide repeat protein [Deltaproteobacteria bacterium]